MRPETLLPGPLQRKEKGEVKEGKGRGLWNGKL